MPERELHSYEKAHLLLLEGVLFVLIKAVRSEERWKGHTKFGSALIDKYNTTKKNVIQWQQNTKGD